MLRRWRIKSGRSMAILVAVGASIVFVLSVSVALATDITVDGDCGDWSGDDQWGTDDNEVLVPDQYDIVPVYATMDVDDGNYCVAFETAENLYLNWGTWVHIYFDTDGDPGEGFSTQCQTGFGSIGAESFVYWEPRTGGDHEIYEWDAGWDFVSEAVTAAPTGSGQQDDTCVEICANAADLGIQADIPPTIKVYLENGDGASEPPPDDIFCIETEYTTAVELSSFTACSELERPNEPWRTWLWPVALLSGVVAVSAGGLVLWRRKGLAR